MLNFLILLYRVSWTRRPAVVEPVRSSASLSPNSGLVADACAAALRAFCSAAQRGRSALETAGSCSFGPALK